MSERARRDDEFTLKKCSSARLQVERDAAFRWLMCLTVRSRAFPGSMSRLECGDQPQDPPTVSEADTDDASYLVALGCTVAFAGDTTTVTDPP